MENLSQTPTSTRDYALLNVVWAGALAALNDVMHASFSAICAKSNRTASSAQAAAATARRGAAANGTTAPRP